MSYILHNRLGSGGFVVEATLELAGLEYTYEPIESKPNTPVQERIAHINPWGQVPVLEVPNGKVLTEVAAIICYLTQSENACHSGPNLWNNDYASFLRWSIFMSVNIYEGILRQSYPYRYFDFSSSSNTESSAREAVIDTAIKTGMALSVKMSARKRVHKAFLLLEEIIHKDEFLLGPQMSCCDIFLAMLYAWHNKQPDLPKCCEITHRIATHTLINPIWERNFHDRLDEKWHEARP